MTSALQDVFTSEFPFQEFCRLLGGKDAAVCIVQSRNRNFIAGVPYYAGKIGGLCDIGDIFVSDSLSPVQKAGAIIHEVGHLIFTPPHSFWGGGDGKRLFNNLSGMLRRRGIFTPEERKSLFPSLISLYRVSNGIEDARIEARLVKNLPGSPPMLREVISDHLDTIKSIPNLENMDISLGWELFIFAMTCMFYRECLESIPGEIAGEICDGGVRASVEMIARQKLDAASDAFLKGIDQYRSEKIGTEFIAYLSAIDSGQVGKRGHSLEDFRNLIGRRYGDLLLYRDDSLRILSRRYETAFLSEISSAAESFITLWRRIHPDLKQQCGDEPDEDREDRDEQGGLGNDRGKGKCGGEGDLEGGKHDRGGRKERRKRRSVKGDSSSCVRIPPRVPVSAEQINSAQVYMSASKYIEKLSSEPSASFKRELSENLYISTERGGGIDISMFSQEERDCLPRYGVEEAADQLRSFLEYEVMSSSLSSRHIPSRMGCLINQGKLARYLQQDWDPEIRIFKKRGEVEDLGKLRVFLLTDASQSMRLSKFNCRSRRRFIPEVSSTRSNAALWVSLVLENCFRSLSAKVAIGTFASQRSRFSLDPSLSTSLGSSDYRDDPCSSRVRKIVDSRYSNTSIMFGGRYNSNDRLFGAPCESPVEILQGWGGECCQDKEIWLKSFYRGGSTPEGESLFEVVFGYVCKELGDGEAIIIVIHDGEPTRVGPMLLLSPDRKCVEECYVDIHFSALQECEKRGIGVFGIGLGTVNTCDFYSRGVTVDNIPMLVDVLGRGLAGFLSDYRQYKQNGTKMDLIGPKLKPSL